MTIAALALQNAISYCSEDDQISPRVLSAFLALTRTGQAIGGGLQLTGAVTELALAALFNVKPLTRGFFEFEIDRETLSEMVRITSQAEAYHVKGALSAALNALVHPKNSLSNQMCIHRGKPIQLANLNIAHILDKAESASPPQPPTSPDAETKRIYEYLRHYSVGTGRDTYHSWIGMMVWSVVITTILYMQSSPENKQ